PPSAPSTPQAPPSAPSTPQAPSSAPSTPQAPTPAPSTPQAPTPAPAPAPSTPKPTASGSPQPLPAALPQPQPTQKNTSASDSSSKVNSTQIPSSTPVKEAASPIKNAVSATTNSTNNATTSSTGASVANNSTNNVTSSSTGASASSNSSGSSGSTAAVTPGGSAGSEGSSKVTATEQEFTSAVSACGFPQPSSEKYKAFIAGIPFSAINSKRELAMFLANVLHESDGLQAKSEIQCQANGCKGQYDAAADGTVFFGRGYIQLTWKANYAAASKDLYGDEKILLSNPNSVATDEKVAWATAFWYWKTRVHTAPGVTEGKFGATIKAINGALECGGGRNQKAVRRFEMYSKIMKAFGINETPIESGCYN
ncbi:hypothetical protein DI09_129p80, partial [Mitosporidium daphniae]